MERTCDACGRKFTFTDFRHDRCPFCCPKDEHDDIWRDDLAQESEVSDWPEQEHE
jgi:hypothetical protein